MGVQTSGEIPKVERSPGEDQKNVGVGYKRQETIRKYGQVFKQK